MNGSKLTSASEIAVYLAAHILGIAAAYVFNPIIFSVLIVAGYQTYVPAVALGISLLIMLVVLCVFLAMRSAFGGGPLQR
jgi:ABC-type sulfate transport system permease component